MVSNPRADDLPPLALLAASKRKRPRILPTAMTSWALDPIRAIAERAEYSWRQRRACEILTLGTSAKMPNALALATAADQVSDHDFMIEHRTWHGARAFTRRFARGRGSTILSRSRSTPSPVPSLGSTTERSARSRPASKSRSSAHQSDSPRHSPCTSGFPA